MIPDPNIEHERRVRRKGRWLWLVLLVPVTLIAAGLIVVGRYAQRLTQYASAAKTLPNEQIAAKREGLPLDPSDLGPSPPVPDSQNAAPLYVKAVELLNKYKGDQRDEFSEYVKGNRCTEQEGLVRKLLRDRADILLLTDRGVRLPRCDFKRKWELGADLELPEYAAMREIARMLSARAVMENADGKPGSAMDTIAKGMEVAKHAGEDSVIISALVEIAMVAILDRPFREIVSTHIDDPLVIRKAREITKQFAPSPNMEYAFRGEVVFGKVTVDQLRRNPKSFSLPLKREFTDTGHGRDFTDACEARLLAHWRRIFSALRSTHNDPLERYRKIKVLSEELEHKEGVPTYEISSIVIPVLYQAQAKVLSSEAIGRLRVVLLDLALYHQHHNSFPNILSELSPDTPHDPFTNKPLIYRRNTTGFILYSVGENFKDDGGRSKKRFKDDKDTDIVVEYPYRLDTDK